MYRFSVTGLLLSLSLICPSVSLADGPSKSVRDWQVYCSNALKCFASSKHNFEGIGAFGFERGPQANAPLVFFITSYDKLVETGDVVVSVRGELGEIRLPVAQGKLTDSTWRIGRQDLIEALFPAMLAGQTLDLTADTQKGRVTTSISLSGVTGAALFLDDVQQRLENRDALVNPGTGEPKAAFTRVKDMGSNSELPQAVDAIWKGGPDKCGVGYDNQDLIKSYGGMNIGLEDDTSLFVLPCGSPGAYNLPFVVYGFDGKEKTAREVQFPVIGQKGPSIISSAYNVSWNDAKSELSAFFKGRGLGDCGISHLWVFRGDANYGNFELLEQRRKDDCDGKYDDWPVIWPIK